MNPDSLQRRFGSVAAAAVLVLAAACGGAGDSGGRAPVTGEVPVATAVPPDAAAGEPAAVTEAGESGPAAAEATEPSAAVAESAPVTGAEADAEKVLTLRYWQAPAVPSPYLSTAYKDEDAAAVTLEPLASYDPDGNLVPRLAAEIPTLDNGGVSEDLTSITWRLKEGLRWSDGAAVTAEDVAFTWRYCAAADQGCAAINIVSVEAADDRTVTVAFDAPTPYPYAAFVGASMPVISRAQFAGCVGAAARACEEQTNALLGTGPYRIVDFEPDRRAVYERNPFYRGEAPYFDRVVLEGGGDAESAARAVLETGEADYGWNLQIAPDLLREMEGAGRGRVAGVFASLVERIFLNQTNPDPALGPDRSEHSGGANPHPFLTFAPIRRAMSLAIDRAAVADLYGFAGEPACNLVVAPANYASTANDGCLAQDIDGAKALLDASGVADSDGDGIREHGGAPLRVAYLTSTNSVRQATQALVGEWWRQIGIDTEAVHFDAGVFFGGDPAEGESYRRFFGDALMFTEETRVDPQQALSLGLCRSIPTRANGWSGENIARVCDPEYDELFARLTHTPIGPERDELVKRLNDIYVQNHYVIPLVNRGLVMAFAADLQGAQANAWDTPLWNIAAWHRD